MVVPPMPMGKNYKFTTFFIKVNTRSPGWQRTVIKVLSSVKEITFMMNEDGIVKISGGVDPARLLKMLGRAGKRAELIQWNFGQCYSNLYTPDYFLSSRHYGPSGYHQSAYQHDRYYGNGSTYGGGNFYGNYSGGGYGGNSYYRPFQPVGYNHGGYGSRHAPGYSSYSVPRTEVPPMAEDVGCCSVM